MVTAKEFWNCIAVYDIMLFCTVSHCEVSISDGKILRVTCKSRRDKDED